MQALHEVGCPVNPTGMGHNDFNPEWGWDIVKAANELHPTASFSPDQFWQSFDRDFWAELPISDEFEDLLSRSESLVGADSVAFLTAPTLDSDCAAGKMDWIYRNAPHRFHRQFIITPLKHFCARPDALLIDDRDDNVEMFAKSGGNAILVPRPWNKNHGIDTGAHISRILNEIILDKWAHLL